MSDGDLFNTIRVIKRIGDIPDPDACLERLYTLV